MLKYPPKYNFSHLQYSQYFLYRHTGKTVRALNLGSYNYLGFAENSGPCTDDSEQAIRDYGLSACSTRHEYGTLNIQVELEMLVARFIGKEAAMVFGMGFATNSTNLPTLVDRKCLIVSDELNHSSLVLGARLSEAKIKVFKHNGNVRLRIIIIAY
jgi:serine palmitoyltransferase